MRVKNWVSKSRRCGQTSNDPLLDQCPFVLRERAEHVEHVEQQLARCRSGIQVPLN